MLSQVKKSKEFQNHKCAHFSGQFMQWNSKKVREMHCKDQQYFASLISTIQRGGPAPKNRVNPISGKAQWLEPPS